MKVGWYWRRRAMASWMDLTAQNLSMPIALKKVTVASKSDSCRTFSAGLAYEYAAYRGVSLLVGK